MENVIYSNYVALVCPICKGDAPPPPKKKKKNPSSYIVALRLVDSVTGKFQMRIYIHVYNADTNTES